VVVVGDVNSTLACAITAAKLWIPVAHVEAGLRSGDRRMPEEINRIVTDALSDFLFTTSRAANENLEREGISPEKIFFVGNVMIDTLLKYQERARALGTPERFGLQPREYALLTLHRPSNVDVPEVFSGILDALVTIQRDLPILFPAHPRTIKRIEEFGFTERLNTASNLHIVEPLGYLEFLDLMMHSKIVLTDSGGIQEETTILGVPCLTLRENTERPITISQGTNSLVGTHPAQIVTEVQQVLDRSKKPTQSPDLWDGCAAGRIVSILQENLRGQKSTMLVDNHNPNPTQLDTSRSKGQ
jgi:UDP-N-acetylglucosamine 2-epimerase (non-hydrolysing)